MNVFDVNLVIAAHRSDHRDHETAHTFIDAVMRRNEPFGVPCSVWASFLRITTNQRIFTVPTPLDDAFEFIRAVVAQPNHLGCEPGSAHLSIFERLCNAHDATGDLVPDAQLAALAIEHGAQLVSFDRDFARFDGLDWVLPTP